ncbi:MAG: ParB/RepB/Spo0J family partition protein [Oscillospiraceae bacterium]|nr:ParB/RepB/Spo0J family partition protein [Oscillospiraceae bacterium]
MAEKAGKRGLGLGLSAILGEDLEEEKKSTLPISRIEPKSDQPRTIFDPEALDELTESIRQYGLIQPITVRPLEGGYYQIIAGERRWRAAREAGLKEVPVNIIEADDKRACELALVENLQREDLNPIEEAKGYKTLMNEYGLTQDQAAAAVGKSRPAVANALRLLKLGDEVLKMVEEGQLSSGHARALIPITDALVQFDTAELIIERGLSVRQTEELVQRILSPKEDKKGSGKDEALADYVREAEKKLENALGRKIKLKDSAKRGKIEIEFYGADDREKLLDGLLLAAAALKKQ